MRKTLSLLLASVLCLSLCACASSKEESKYVGTYTGNFDRTFRVWDNETFQARYSLVLHSGGTGKLTLESLETIKSPSINKYEIKKGDALLQYELLWKVVDGYLVIDGSGKKYYTCQYESSSTLIQDFGSIGTPISISESYQLKGNQLVNVAGDYAEYTKVD